MPSPDPIEARFWGKVLKTRDCWLWLGKLVNGYGRFTGRVTTNRIERAHRAAYEMFVGPIPDGLTLDHLCHTNDPTCPGGSSCPHRRCVNPAHLEPCTRGENSLRGNSEPAINARKSACDNGHPFEPSNTYLWQGQRHCQTCRQDQNRKTVQRRSQERRPSGDRAVCALGDCSTCQPSAPPLDVVAEEQRAAETNYAVWWLISAYPDVWYFAKPETVQAVAARLVRLRTAINARRIAR